MERKAGEHGHEKDPEDGKDAHAGLADDMCDDAENGQWDRQDNPFKDLHEPTIDPFDALCDHGNKSTRLV
mgnify:CR=1 FL=1